MESADFLLPVIVLMQIGSPWVTQKTFSNILISFLYSLPHSTLKSRDALFNIRLIFVTSNPSDFLLRDKSCSSTTRMDFHHLVYCAAKRL